MEYVPWHGHQLSLNQVQDSIAQRGFTDTTYQSINYYVDFGDKFKFIHSYSNKFKEAILTLN